MDSINLIHYNYIFFYEKKKIKQKLAHLCYVRYPMDDSIASFNFYFVFPVDLID